MAAVVNTNSAEDMYAALGAGDIRLSQVINAAQKQVDTDAHDEQLDLELPVSAAKTLRTMKVLRSAVLVTC